MSMAHLGPSFDIHTGGVDLIFPHHEDEIAQSEAATGQPFVRTWLHCAHLQMGGAEDGQVAPATSPASAELLDGGVPPRALRYALIAVHYRAPLELQRATPSRPPAAAIDRLDAAVAALGRLPRGAARTTRRCRRHPDGRARRLRGRAR